MSDRRGYSFGKKTGGTFMPERPKLFDFSTPEGIL
jgi:hypothetical protein